MEKKPQTKHLGRIRKRPGQSVFCLNLQTGEISTVPGSRIEVKPHCIYRQCLNRENFLRKLKNEGITVKKQLTNETN